MNNMILSISNLTKKYGNATALHDVNLDVREGEFLTFLGPSGSGKTTTLNLIAGFIEPTSGTMLLQGEPLERKKAHERNLGVVFQHYALFPHLTVEENVEYPLKQRKVSRAERKKSVAEALEMVQLGDFADRYPRELSGGQQQRVAVARAVVYRPPILLMDEPLGALDKKLREWLQMELRRIHRELGSTFIYVTHDQEEALALSDRIAVFNQGRIEQIGTAHELYNSPQTLFVGEFIGESTIFKGEVAGEVITCGAHQFGIQEARFDGDGAILIRPESMTIVDRSTEGSDSGLHVNRVSGKILDVVYLGSAYKYSVATDLGEAMVRSTADGARVFEIGDEVTLEWKAEDSVLLPDS